MTEGARSDRDYTAAISLPATDSVFTDSALKELRKQADEGCLLCSVPGLDDEEDWD